MDKKLSTLEQVAEPFKTKGGGLALALALLLGIIVGSTYCANSSDRPPVNIDKANGQ